MEKFLILAEIYPLCCILTLRKQLEESVDELFQDPATYKSITMKELSMAFMKEMSMYLFQ